MRTSVKSEMRVLVATPIGRGGAGGIDRLMDRVASHLRKCPHSVRAEFQATRGAGRITFAPFVLLVFLLRMYYLRVLGRVQVVHINVSRRGSTYRKLIISEAAHLVGIPTVLHLHSGAYREFWQEAPPWIRRRMRRMFSHSRRILVLGRVWRDFVADMAPEARERIIILPNATPAPAPRRAPGTARDLHIIFLGKVGPAKGVRQLVDALKQLESLPNWRATIAGDGDVEATAARITALGLSARVRLPGWVGPAAVEELIATADILTLPSFSENLPMSVIEAMAAGLAVIATPVGAVEDIICDGGNGLLVPPGDSQALAGALGRLISDESLRARLGAAAMATHREKLDISPYVRKLVDLWQEVAREEAGSR